MGRHLSGGKELRLKFLPDPIQTADDRPGALMDADLQQPFFALVAEGNVATGEDHVGSARLRPGGYPYLPVGKTQVFPEQFLEAGLFQIGHFSLAVDHRNLAGGERNQPVQEGTAIKQ